MKRKLLWLLGLLLSVPAWAVSVPEREEEAWRLRVLSRELAERDGTTLRLTLDRGRKLMLRDRCSSETCIEWIWIGLDATHRFHRVWRRNPNGQDAWAWVARRDGHMTQMGGEPVTPFDDRWLVWVEPRQRMALRLASASGGRLREIRLMGAERIHHITDLRWWPEHDMWTANATGSNGRPVWLNLVRDGRMGWRLMSRPSTPPPPSHE